VTPERWAQIREIVERALDSSDRGVLVEEACRGDDELRREVESLLEQHSDSGDPILDRPAWEMPGIWIPPRSQTREGDGGGPHPWIPRQVGKYRILSLLGEGGMGAVYQAEQDHPRRLVALKVMRPGCSSPELLRRFELESQALGRLQHPGIAQIYEGGTADTGFGPQPYFAMEFIRGETLRDYVQSHRPNTRRRLELVAKICEAVDHAHRRGLIHRDLKPGNILVDAAGHPKILDFGVSRVTDSDAMATRQTDIGQLVGTLAYMSPEQVLADPLELDTRSDVYSLGVILYELLADRLPYKLSDKLHEAAQAIREEDPARLSLFSRNYKGDVETIVAKALEKDKTRRYGSAAELGADIRRYLADEPIVARAPSATYQLQKFARRHKALVAGVAAVFIVLVGGIAATTLEALHAREERDAASAISDFLQRDLLAQAGASAQAGPDTEPDPDLKVRTALDRAAARIGDRFGKQPLVEAAIRQTFADTYRDLGRNDQAEVHAERSLEIRRHALGEEDKDTLSSMASLAGAYNDDGKWDRGEPLSEKVVEIERRLWGERNMTTLASMNELAVLYRAEGKFAQAEPLHTRVLEIRKRMLGEEHPDTLSTMNGLGVLFRQEGKIAQAEALYTRVLAVAPRVLGDSHPETLLARNNLAVLYANQGRFADADSLYSAVLETQRRALGEESPNTVLSMANLAVDYTAEGKNQQAESLLDKVLEVRRRTLGEEHHDTLVSMSNLAILYTSEGKYAQSERLFHQVLEIERRVLGNDHPDTLVSMIGLARLYRVQARSDAAAPLLEQVLEVRRRALGQKHPSTLDVAGSLADVRVEQQRYLDAERLAGGALAEQQTTNPSDWKRYRSESVLGASLAGQRKFGEAEPLLLSGYQGMLAAQATIPSQRLWELREGGRRIVAYYLDAGMRDKAKEWRNKAEGATSIRSQN
jgi:tetratricopeptide (TPR) repeat protein